jgi:hypothetical protein
MWIFNHGAAACDGFPASGQTIGRLSANTALSIPSGKSAEFYGVSATGWGYQLSA